MWLFPLLKLDNIIFRGGSFKPNGMNNLIMKWVNTKFILCSKYKHNAKNMLLTFVC